MIVNTVPVKQHEEDYIRPNADLETRLQIRSNEHLKCVYLECWDDIGEFSWRVRLDPNKPRVHTPHKEALSVVFGLKKRVRSDWKTRHD